MDYGFAHDGKVYTPNGTTGVALGDNEDRNEAIQAAELKRWTEKPERQLAYYDTTKGIVTTWLGVELGRITSVNVYQHNFGARMVSMRVRGTNGAEYYGRASYDWGTCINLRRAK